MEASQITFTRYLYDKTEVKHSLFLSILQHNIHESLFWGYELYYSGFEEEAFEFITLILNTIYKDSCSFIQSYYDEMVEKWNTDNNPIYFGNLIATLCTKKYDLKQFCKDYLKVEGVQNEERPKNVLIVELHDDYINEFKTKHSNKIYHTLKDNCIYPVHKNINNLFNISRPDYKQVKTNYYDHWLYYASFSPIWEERILQFQGTVNHDTKRVDFINDECMETFYEHFGFEPDEQSAETQEKIIGKENVKQTTIKEFCKEFHFQLLIKIKKRT